MERMHRLAWVLAIAGALAAPAPLAATGDDGPWHDWTRLRLKARKMLFFSGRIEMELREEDGRRVLETQTHARFMGIDIARSRTVSVLDPQTGRTIEYSSLSPKRGRHYVFGERSYTVKKLSPARGFDAPIEQWKVKSTDSYDYPRPEPGTPAPVVYDYYGMILRLGAVPLEKSGDEVVLYVATSKGPQAYRIRVAETRETRRSFRDLRDGSKRNETIRELRLRVAPDDPGSAHENFLDMEGESELWVESRSRTLIEIGGKIPKVPGRVEVELDSIG